MKMKTIKILLLWNSHCLLLQSHNQPTKHCKTFLSANKEFGTRLLFCPCSFLPWGPSTTAPSNQSFILFCFTGFIQIPNHSFLLSNKGLGLIKRVGLPCLWPTGEAVTCLLEQRWDGPFCSLVHPCLSGFPSLLIRLLELMLMCFDIGGTWFLGFGIICRFCREPPSHRHSIFLHFSVTAARQAFGDADAGLIRADRARMLISSCSVARRRG